MTKITIPDLASRETALDAISAHEEAATAHAAQLAAEARNRELLDLIALALPYVEDAADDPAFKALRVSDLARRMRAAVETAQ